jgi:transposase
MNKEDDHLPQINLALLFGEQSNLPFYYRKLPGNIADIDFLDYKKIKLVMTAASTVKITLMRCIRIT